MARTRLFNPKPQLQLKYNPYQQSFLEARRLRYCPGRCVVPGASPPRRLVWSTQSHPGKDRCPGCELRGIRVYTRLFSRAGRQSGKTVTGALSLVEELTIPDNHGWACAPSVPELEDYVIPAFCRVWPQSWFDHPMVDWSEERLTLTVLHGGGRSSSLKFRSLDDPNRATGDTIDYIWLDEGRKIQELAYHLSIAMVAVREGAIFSTSSPDWGEDWLHRNFWEPAEAGVPGYWATTYKSTESPVINPRVIEAARITMSPELFRREFEASIEYPTGTIYGNLVDRAESNDDRIREWLPEWPAVDPSRPSLAPLDPGTDHPFAGLHIVATVKGLIVVAEYEERNKLYLEHAQGLKAMVGASSPRWGIDKSQKQASIELQQHGIHCTPAENAVEAGIQRVYSWLAADRMRIARSTCPKLLKRLRSYRWAELGENSKGLPEARPFKKDDDLPDALRYGVMMWPELPHAALSVEDKIGMDRSLALLSEHHQREILIASDIPETEDDLVRVTDDFSPMLLDHQENALEGVGDFYV